MATSRDFYQVLQSVNFEIVGTPTETERRIQIHGRVRSQTKRWAQDTVKRLIVARQGSPWTIDISREYFPRGEDLFWRWRIIIQSDNLGEHLGDIISLVQQSLRPAPGMEVTEIPLVGSPKTRNVMINGKGAVAARGS